MSNLDDTYTPCNNEACFLNAHIKRNYNKVSEIVNCKIVAKGHWQKHNLRKQIRGAMNK